MNDPGAGDRSRQADVNAVLAEYMQRVDRGEDVDREQFVAQQPDLSTELRQLLRCGRSSRPHGGTCRRIGGARRRLPCCAHHPRHRRVSPGRPAGTRSLSNRLNRHVGAAYGLRHSIRRRRSR